jgi:LysM repeat protein
MYDSVTVTDIPATAKLVAGYVDGRYNNINALHRRFPHAVVVGIATNAHTNDGHVLDVETGDATPKEAVQWVVMRRHAGKDPSVYCNASAWPHVKAAFKAAHVNEPHYWIAQWDGSAKVPEGAVAKQYKDAEPGHHYDTSVVKTYWPGVDSKPAPPHYYVVKAGDTLSEIAHSHHMSLEALEAKNKQIHNPDLIFPGQHIHL